MKSKSNKISKARAAKLAAVIASREADTATHCTDLARERFKKARKAYKQARKAAKRAAKRAKQAQKKFAPLAKYLKQPKPKTARKPAAKSPKLKPSPVAGGKTRVAPKPVADKASSLTAVTPPTAANPTNPPGI